MSKRAKREARKKKKPETVSLCLVCHSQHLTHTHTHTHTHIHARTHTHSQKRRPHLPTGWHKNAQPEKLNDLANRKRFTLFQQEKTNPKSQVCVQAHSQISWV